MYGSHLVVAAKLEKHVPARKLRRQNIQVLGFDSETMHGPPITLQFVGTRHTGRFTGCIFIGKRRAIDLFLRQLKKLRPGRYRMYGHNLEFDMLSALWEQRASMRDGTIDLRIGDWTISGRYSKPVFAEFNDGERIVELVDSMLWFQTSLSKAGELVCPGLPKLPRPAGLGEQMFTAADDDFVEYAMRDAVVAQKLGEAIEKFHEDLDITSQVSLASMAQAVFRRHYMQSDMYQPPEHAWMVGAAAAYHGGKNNVIPGAAPAWHMNCTALDLSSAYPDAMRRLPAFSDPRGYKSFRTRQCSKVKSVERLGVYKISGRASRCSWPALFDHNFKTLKGAFRDVWVTGVELNQALSHEEVRLVGIDGFLYDACHEGGYSPFREYTDTFYALKASATDPVFEYLYKIMLNALTGKFIQTSPDFTLVDGQLVTVRRAGGLYHPFVAGAITGDTRAIMHQHEHDYGALHTATDGLFVPGYHVGAKKKELGALMSEGHGDLALLRGKLYLFYGDEPTSKSVPSQIFENKHVLKHARHGFQGSLLDLERMIVSKSRRYQTDKPLKLKTALRKGEDPNKFVKTERNLRNIDQLRVVEHA